MGFIRIYVASELFKASRSKFYLSSTLKDDFLKIGQRRSRKSFILSILRNVVEITGFDAETAILVYGPLSAIIDLRIVRLIQS